MLQLLIDTSGPYTMAAVADEGKLLGECTVQGRPAARIHELIRLLLMAVTLPLEAIDRIAVTVGPGSWTGLNIGVTAAKVLAQVRKCPVVTVSALDALVAVHHWDRGRTWAICKAGRGKANYSLYARGPALTGLESGITEFGALRDRLLQDGDPMVLEYGQTFRPDLSELPAVNYACRERLPVEGMILAARAAAPLHLEEVLALTPDYLQPALAEQDAQTV